jgi:hypothetical protein
MRPDSPAAEADIRGQTPPTSPGPIPSPRAHWPAIVCSVTHLYLVAQVLLAISVAVTLLGPTYSSTTVVTLNADGTTSVQSTAGSTSVDEGRDWLSFVLIAAGGMLSLLALMMILGLLGRRRWVIGLAKVWLVLGLVMLLAIVAVSIAADRVDAGGASVPSSGPSMRQRALVAAGLTLRLGLLAAWLTAIPGAILLLRRRDRLRGRPPALG